MLFASFMRSILTGNQLTAFLAVVCFSAGLNVYATVVMLGLLTRAQVLALPPGLHLLGSWSVIGVCGALFLIEFVGDKIPIFDLVWNALHTFVRVPVAALLTYSATAQMSEWQRLLATLVGALIALAAHSGKTAARAAVTHSPEPFSNVALSLGEDATVVFLTWFATRQPYMAAGIVAVALGIIAVMMHVVVRAMQKLFEDAEGTLAKKTPPRSAR